MRYYYSQPPEGYNFAQVYKVGSRLWRLANDFVTPYQTVPIGYYSDGASIPRFFWVFSDPAGEFFEAALVHDYMYSKAVHTKEEADNAFLNISLDYGVAPWKAKIAYFFVKHFGKGSY